jgi:hypothetical protein
MVSKIIILTPTEPIENEDDIWTLEVCIRDHLKNDDRLFILDLTEISSLGGCGVLGITSMYGTVAEYEGSLVLLDPNDIAGELLFRNCLTGTVHVAQDTDEASDLLAEAVDGTVVEVNATASFGE